MAPIAFEELSITSMIRRNNMNLIEFLNQEEKSYIKNRYSTYVSEAYIGNSYCPYCGVDFYRDNFGYGDEVLIMRITRIYAIEYRAYRKVTSICCPNCYNAIKTVWERRYDIGNRKYWRLDQSIKRSIRNNSKFLK